MQLEYLSYSTNQKGQFALNQDKPIVLASSNPCDIVAHSLCRSGEKLAISEKIGRRWIGPDLSEFAIQVTWKRYLKSCMGKSYIRNRLTCFLSYITGFVYNNSCSAGLLDKSLNGPDLMEDEK